MSTPLVFRSRWLSPAEPQQSSTREGYEPTKTTKTTETPEGGARGVFVGFVGAELAGIQNLAPSSGRVLTFAERAARANTALSERFCPACGFSFWSVSERGDSSCFGCELLRAGKSLRCAHCGAEEWHLDSAGRRSCGRCVQGKRE